MEKKIIIKCVIQNMACKTWKSNEWLVIICKTKIVLTWREWERKETRKKDAKRKSTISLLKWKQIHYKVCTIKNMASKRFNQMNDGW